MQFYTLIHLHILNADNADSNIQNNRTLCDINGSQLDKLLEPLIDYLILVLGRISEAWVDNFHDSINQQFLITPIEYIRNRMGLNQYYLF